MQNHVVLLGAENVQRAAATMQDAADVIQRAADQMEHTMFKHRAFLDDWLYRFQAAIDAARKESM